MAKISQAEKNRRKEQKIFAQFDRILECLESAYRKQNSFEVGEQLTWVMAFERGVYCASGISMYRKLQKHYEDWYDSHIELVNLYKDKIEHNKKYGAYETSLTSLFEIIQKREEEHADEHETDLYSLRRRPVSDAETDSKRTGLVQAPRRTMGQPERR